MSVAEDISFVPSIKTGADYLQNVKRVLGMSQIKYIIDDKIGSRNIGGVDFDVLTMNTTLANMTIFQEYFVTIKKGYALSLVITHTTPETKLLLNNILGTIKFDN